MTGPGNGTIYFRADHDLVGRVIAEKLRRRNDRSNLDDSISITEDVETLNRRRVASGVVG